MNTMDRISKHSTTDEDGTTTTIQWVMDYDADVSWLGTFTDKPGPDTVARDPRRVNRHEYKYIKLGYPVAQRFKDLQRRGESRGPAWAQANQQAREDIAMLERIASGLSWFEACIVTISLGGCELAHASLWGIHEPDDDDKREIERDLLTEARAEMKGNALAQFERLRVLLGTLSAFLLVYVVWF